MDIIKLIKNSRIVALIAAIYLIFITMLSLINLSHVKSPDMVIGFDKVVHFCFYFGLSSLLLRVNEISRHLARKFSSLFVVICVILYGVMIEVAQHFVGREFSIWDIAANSLGAVVAVLLYRRFIYGRY